jgi:hypothetical protein
MFSVIQFLFIHLILKILLKNILLGHFRFLPQCTDTFFLLSIMGRYGFTDVSGQTISPVFKAQFLLGRLDL